MILDSLINAQKYYSLHPGFQKAFEYLKNTNCAELAPGKHEIDGSRMFVLVASNTGKGRNGVKLEVHQKYIDIQISVKGFDEMGWRALNQCLMVDKPYDDKADIAFYDDPPHTWFNLKPNDFVVFFPQDAHAPFATEGHLVKAVVKVAVDY